MGEDGKSRREGGEVGEKDKEKWREEEAEEGRWISEGGRQNEVRRRG